MQTTLTDFLISFYHTSIIPFHSFKGNINLFTRFTEWEGPHVLYFGDHVYSDLMVRHFHSSIIKCVLYPFRQNGAGVLKILLLTVLQ